MTADPATTLAAQHQYRESLGGWGGPVAWCTCDKWTMAGARERFANGFAEHQLSVLSATHAIIELPEGSPDYNTDYYPNQAHWMVETPDHLVGLVAVEGEKLTPSEARSAAAALLSAARDAEEAGQ